MKVPFYWKTTCHTCRAAKTSLEDSGIRLEAIDIIKDPPSEKIFRALIKKYGIKNMIRKNAKEYRMLKVGKIQLSEDQLAKVFHSYPDLSSRPIVLVDGEAYISKDPELQKRLHA